VIKLRGLPWNVTIEDIHTFLTNINVPQGGVHLMNGANGRPSGLAYVELSSEDDQAEALRRDKQSIGGRYIDVFACSQTELQARLAGGLERGGSGSSGNNAADAHFAKLRGLPYQATEQQIAAFFQPLQVVAVQIAFNANGQPSGFGFVQFRTPDDASAALGRSNQVLGSRYVEVFRCSRAEMEQARMHALSAMPFMRGQQAMAPPGGPMGGRGGQGAHANGMGGGHRAPSESAYAAYQAALQTLATRQQQSYAASQVSGYPAAGAYGGAEAYGANGAMNGAHAASYGGSYGNAEAYGATAGYGQSAGYGQVAGGYGGGASAAGGYGTAPASAAYASAGASAAQGSYYPARAHPRPRTVCVSVPSSLRPFECLRRSTSRLACRGGCCQWSCARLHDCRLRAVLQLLCARALRTTWRAQIARSHALPATWLDAPPRTHRLRARACSLRLRTTTHHFSRAVRARACERAQITRRRRRPTNNRRARGWFPDQGSSASACQTLADDPR
jgi:hypothetical protein